MNVPYIGCKSCYQDISPVGFLESGPSGKAETPAMVGKGNVTVCEVAKMLSEIIPFHECAHVGKNWVREHGCVCSQTKPGWMFSLPRGQHL